MNNNINSDELSDEQLNNLFDSADVPPLDTNRKQQAINLALSEFSQHQQEKTSINEKKFQGFWSFLRLTSDKSSEERESIMTFLHNKLFYSGAATVSVAVIGVLLFDPSQHPLTDSPIPLPLSLNKGIISEQKTDSVTQYSSDDSRTSRSANKNDAKKVLDQQLLGDVVAPAPLAAAAQTRSKIEGQRKSKARSKLSFQEAPAGRSQLAEAKTIVTSNSGVSAGKLRLESPLPVAPKLVGKDNFEHSETNGIKLVTKEPTSTFSIDVDTASYSFIRRQLNQGVLPQKDAVRLEELVNYFDYHYPLPESKEQPFKPTIVVHPSPWAEGKQLLHIGLKGYEIDKTEIPKSNIVLLLDVSGSMHGADRLPLVKQSMLLLLNSLQANDTVAIVVYAGAAGQVLEPTPVKQKQKILAALDRLSAGGSTAGGEGIKLAYQLAEANFDKNAVNRIILATDGDFNVGINNRDELTGFVERKRQQGIFLSILGFGQGNYNDQMMQTLAQNGNGVAAYIDSLSEAQKVLVNEATSTLFPIAKDVKIQIEFNPKQVSEYRLLGYETRHLQQEDFNNDKVDAGDIGAGHTVTAIYEIVLAHSNAQQIEPLRYSKNNVTTTNENMNNELAFFKIRYKLPNQTQSKLISHKINRSDNDDKNLSAATQRDINFATAVAAFAQLLKNGQYINNYHYKDIITLAQANKGADEFGYRTEFIQLVRKAIVASDL